MSTLEDVAQHAGVSKSTVSRVFNQPDKVKTSTLQKVQAAVDALDYRPSRVARRLRVANGTAHMLGLVIPDIQNPFFADITRGVEDIARANDYALILSNSDEDPQQQKRSLDTLRTEDVDGVIVPPVHERDADVEALVRSGVPAVCVDRRVRGVAVDTIVSDNRQGAHEAVAHLIAAGHQRIGFIGGIPHLSTTKERQQGYEDALREHSIEPDPALVRTGDSRQESGRRLTNELFDLSDPPTALFTGNNLTMLGAYVAFHERGLRIPEDVAVVGYDDVAWALALNPPPTVVSQPGYEMGRRAAEMLLQRIAQPDASASVVTLQPKLIVRASCGS